ncbi:hypothetical protein [Pseudofrankia asymbiotica]|uniref:hypothetical protein n=1 Tax=Pseudofrankia asymbiotica TaxID=1834516 RepID=UPI000BBA0E6F|nr:hypothetical protein [Pseudofrankia asymbiotica]
MGRWAETPYARAQRRREQVHDAFLDARDELRAVLEDLIEGETRAVCPAATDLDVEVYADELGEPRGRLIAVNTDEDEEVTDEQEDTVRDQIVELLDEWAVTANADSVTICFRQLPALPRPAATVTP